jgi:hypothetical protein
MNSQLPESSRKHYQTPELVVYGNVRDITQNISNTNMMSDNAAMTTKTS